MPSRRWKRMHRPSPAMFVACLALFVALGGTSYAAITITSRNVKNNSLTGKDIRNRSLTSIDIKDRSLKARDLAPGVLSSGSGTGSTGSTGATGATGAAGAAASTAFARIDATGKPVAGVSRGINFVARPSKGITCLDDTSGTPLNLQLTADNSAADPRKAMLGGTVDPATVSKACPAPADIVVSSAYNDGQGQAEYGFYVAILG